MIHRLTLVTGAFLATAIMSFAAGAQTAPPPADAGATPEVLVAAPVVAPAAVPAPTTPQTVTDTVYVAVADEPAVIRVIRHAPPVATTPVAPTKTAAAPRHREGDEEREDEHEGGESEGEGD